MSGSSGFVFLRFLCPLRVCCSAILHSLSSAAFHVVRDQLAAAEGLSAPWTAEFSHNLLPGMEHWFQ